MFGSYSGKDVVLLVQRGSDFADFLSYRVNDIVLGPNNYMFLEFEKPVECNGDEGGTYYMQHKVVCGRFAVYPTRTADERYVVVAVLNQAGTRIVMKEGATPRSEYWDLHTVNKLTEIEQADPKTCDYSKCPDDMLPDNLAATMPYWERAAAELRQLFNQQRAIEENYDRLGTNLYC